MVNDIAAFLDYRRKLTVDLINGDSIEYDIILNIPTGTYYKIVCNTISLQESKNVNYQVDSILQTTYEILHLSDKRITTDWIMNNISIENQTEIITLTMGEINKILENECFKIPDLKVVKKKSENSKNNDREKTKMEIEHLQEIIGNKYVTLMDDIAIVSSKTSNDYFAIMKMPIFIFKNLVRTIILNELRIDDDVNLAYLKYVFERLNNEYSGKKEIKAENKPRGLTGANKKKLLEMLG